MHKKQLEQKCRRKENGRMVHDVLIGATQKGKRLEGVRRKYTSANLEADVYDLTKNLACLL